MYVCIIYTLYVLTYMHIATYAFKFDQLMYLCAYIDV